MIQDDQLFFPEILKPYFSKKMIEKISAKHHSAVEALILEQALRYADAVVEEEGQNNKKKPGKKITRNVNKRRA
jgi:hypothetical protein